MCEIKGERLKKRPWKADNSIGSSVKQKPSASGHPNKQLYSSSGCTHFEQQAYLA
jgi:hypothetical protein